MNSCAESEHLLYLQLRKDVLEQRWIMDPMEEMGLAALALTIEFGPYNPKVSTTNIKNKFFVNSLSNYEKKRFLRIFFFLSVI